MTVGIRKQDFPIGEWINLLDRNKYAIRKKELAGIYYIRNSVDGQGYIGLSHNLHSRISLHIHTIKYKDEFMNKPVEYLKENKVLNFHQQLWKYNLNEIELCILWAIDTKSVDRVELDKLLSEKERYYIKKYDTAANGYNMSRGGIDGVRTLNEESHKRMCIANKKKATNGDNRVYCYNIKTGERISCISKPALEVYINHNIYNDQLHKFSVVDGKYLVARNVNDLEDRIQYYYEHADLCGKYHNNDISIDKVIDLYKGISCADFTKKYGVVNSTYSMYQERLNMVHTFLTDDMREYILTETEAGTFNKWDMLRKYAIALKTIQRYVEISIKDGWDYINKKKADGTYIHSKDYFFVVSRAITPYEYFMYRYTHDLSDTAKHFNLSNSSETKLMHEAYNNMYCDKFKSMYIDGVYPIHYTDLYTIERKTESEYKYLDTDSSSNMYNIKYNSGSTDDSEYVNDVERFPVGKWINFTDRFKYAIPERGVAGVFYFKNNVDGKGYILYSHDLFRFIAYHTSIIDAKESYKNCDDEVCEINNVSEWHKALWKFEPNQIEMCLLYEIDKPHLSSRNEIEKTLYQKHLEFIEQYDTIKNGYNGFSKSNNIIYCYDTKTKKRFCCSSSVALGKVINKRIVTRQYTNDTTLLCFDRYIISRSVDNLEDKIETYYRHCDPNGVYHVEYISNEVIEEMFKTTEMSELRRKHDISESAVIKYRKCFNITYSYLTDDIREFILSEVDAGREMTPDILSLKYGIARTMTVKFIETALKDGWSVVNAHKESGVYEDSANLFMYPSRRQVSVYDYFMYREEHSIEETYLKFGLRDEIGKVYESFNSLNYSRLHSLYIEKKYPYNYWVSESLERKSKIDYEVIGDCTDDCTDECIA